MKGFSARERRIIAAVYRDCERIAREREWEQSHGEPTMNGRKMAGHLAELFPCRARQVIKYGVDLPYRKPKWMP